MTSTGCANLQKKNSAHGRTSKDDREERIQRKVVASQTRLSYTLVLDVHYD